MKVHRILRRQMIPISMTAAWAFFSDPMNLSKITPPWLDFEVISDIPKKMHSGMIITYRITPLAGIPIFWISEITHVKTPTFFVDEQRIGPFRFWHHQHFFKETTQGAEMQDIVHYAMPYGPFGELVHGSFVRKKLEAIFDFREKTLMQIFL